MTRVVARLQQPSNHELVALARDGRQILYVAENHVRLRDRLHGLDAAAQPLHRGDRIRRAFGAEAFRSVNDGSIVLCAPLRDRWRGRRYDLIYIEVGVSESLVELLQPALRPDGTLIRIWS
ncbi:hypothetical protein Back2_18080 [Nocardioides baekrokdamisoli]|uniref:Uncharacterized protein n=1 Tax=Nocardioides baekrokdamisoli TaxID=1804624 RepID=A0A3G9IV32_9ACTN|nr:hypothetical protein [Nocardioides baekrokdamisoli]BBH17521.1 hypothetical protein Back2_18080 [Nocardioides baekrokdamisoli]